MGIRFRISLLVPTVIALLLVPATPAITASQQRVNYSIAGDCVDYFEETGRYAFFEEEDNWSCYTVVRVTPGKPVRIARMQFWNGRKWIQESSSRTNSKGVAILKFDPYCEDGYCDGTWKYRIVVDSTSSQKSSTSKSFFVTFYPGSYDDYDEDDDY
jgi:hypothetical protein